MGKKTNKKIVKAANKLLGAIYANMDVGTFRFDKESHMESTTGNFIVGIHIRAEMDKLSKQLSKYKNNKPVILKEMVKDFNSIPMPTITPKVYKYSPIVPIEEDESALPKQCKECKGTGKVLESYNDGIGHEMMTYFPVVNVVGQA